MPAMLMALLLCEQALPDDQGRVILENPIDGVWVRSAGRLTPLPAPYFYARVFVDAPGDYRLRVALVDPAGALIDEEDSVLLHANDVSQTLAFFGRLALGLGDVGRYEVRLFANGAYVAHVPFHVRAPE